MRISERLLKQYLKHVYWICGGPCGGKSTMAELISTRRGMIFYSSDDHTFEYKQLANPQDHPAILRYFVDWEWYFLGQGNDRNQWLVDPERAKRETLDGIIANTRKSLQQARQQHVPYYIRNARTTKEEMLTKIEAHFGLA